MKKFSTRYRMLFAIQFYILYYFGLMLFKTISFCRENTIYERRQGYYG